MTANLHNPVEENTTAPGLSPRNPEASETGESGGVVPPTAGEEAQHESDTDLISELFEEEH